MKHTANYIDIHVGKRIRKFRELKNVSQTELGAACGITFQQIQKYETGRNRVSASRLHQIATFLNVTIAAFFDGVGVCNDNIPDLTNKQKKAADVAAKLTDHQYKAWMNVAKMVEDK